MAKVQSLDSKDLMVPTSQNRSATPQRGAVASVPSAELIPLQFRMPPDFVRAFKQEALNQDMKLNEFLKTCFDEFMKTAKS
jgi:hypothetical protein